MNVFKATWSKILISSLLAFIIGFYVSSQLGGTGDNELQRQARIHEDDILEAERVIQRTVEQLRRSIALGKAAEERAGRLGEILADLEGTSSLITSGVGRVKERAGDIENWINRVGDEIDTSRGLIEEGERILEGL